MADNSDAIAALKAKRRTGVRSHTTDGTSTQYDLEELRRQQRALELEDDVEQTKRPIAATIRLDNLFS